MGLQVVKVMFCFCNMSLMSPKAVLRSYISIKGFTNPIIFLSESWIRSKPIMVFKTHIIRFKIPTMCFL